jgi:glutathione peroxidase
MSGFHDLQAELPNGDNFAFQDLKGKVVLIVNVASKWFANAI